jgi:hypothetical protein
VKSREIFLLTRCTEGFSPPLMPRRLLPVGLYPPWATWREEPVSYRDLGAELGTACRPRCRHVRTKFARILDERGAPEVDEVSSAMPCQRAAARLARLTLARP